MYRRIFASALALGALLVVPEPLRACPFCSAVAQTFTEQIDSMDVVVVAKLLETHKLEETFDAGDELPKAKFEVVEFIKGPQHLKNAQQVQVVYFGSAPKGSLFLLMGVDPPKLTWSIPLALSPRAKSICKSSSSCLATIRNRRSLIPSDRVLRGPFGRCGRFAAAPMPMTNSPASAFTLWSSV